MTSTRTRTENRQILDWARALAALAVCVSHIRNMLLQDYVPGMSVFGKVFYFVTNYGHSAVIVFFVLSGFFVGGSVMRASDKGSFSWRVYLADRLTRLWIVLLPALIVTLIWDSAGLALIGGSFYDGTQGNADQTANVASQLSIATFICNGAFLQTVICPTYGSNGPLWSLANEFWYYLWFPVLLGLALQMSRLMQGPRAATASSPRERRGRRGISIGLALLALVSMALISDFLEGFLIWLLGAGAAWLENRRPKNLRFASALPWLALILFGGLLIAARLGRANDLALGFGFFVFLIALLWRKPLEAVKSSTSSKRLRLLAMGPFLSRFSYSLYLTHFPLTLFICAWMVRHRLPYSALSLGLFTAMLGCCYLYAYGFYWLFERNTGALRAALSRYSATLCSMGHGLPRTDPVALHGEGTAPPHAMDQKAGPLGE